MGHEVWRNWGRNQSSTPREVAVPADVDAVALIVQRAADDGRTVKAVGSGHSFTATAVADDIQLRLDHLDQVISVDESAGLVTVGAGVPLHRLNAELEARGLSMSNLGDIDAQTVAGAVSTGTHGTGAALGGLATQVRGLQLVLADGSIVNVSDESDPELFRAARVGIGAFGVITAVTLQCEPLFHLTAVEEPLPLERVLEEFDALADGNEHFEFYWFPHTDVALTKRNNRPAAGAAAKRLPRWREWLDDELLSNGVFELIQRLGYHRPAVVPRFNRLSARALSARTFTDVSHRVFVSPRRVRFREMEYAVPRERLVETFRAIQAHIDRDDAVISFPVEVRVAAADDIWLSTASGRASGYIAVHQWHRIDYEPYFRAVEAIATEVGGRPHWGKLHWLDAVALRERYPRFDDAMAVRDRVDPNRLFSNTYTKQVFGS
ncbi:MAG TPA: D-arabinono-1,4-lactone oxidase [Mycobacteriales bacterium]|nr:D-arabinono-1,4-lactone oxidase [Mycobacteriales bacterium]